LNDAKTAIILVLFCCSCASKNPVSENRPFIYLTDNVKFFLLPAEDIEKPIDMEQRISASWQDNEYIFNAWVKADETETEMILMNELGVNMGKLSYRNGILFLSSPVFPKSIKPEYIVADFQLCFYRADALRQVIEAGGLIFENSGNSRRILLGKTVIIEIVKSGNTIVLKNNYRGYTYTLEGDFK